MLLFSNIFDSLSGMDYEPELFGKALPCLIAIGCALPPDYSLSISSDDDLYGKPTGGVNFQFIKTLKQLLTFAFKGP